MLNSLRFFFAMIFLSHAGLANEFWSENRVAGVWPVITVHEGNDLHQLEATMQKTREEVRDKLWYQLMDGTRNLAELGGNPADIAQTLAGIMLSFDRIQDQHKAIDKTGFDKTLMTQIRAGFDSFMSVNQIDNSLRRASFISPIGDSEGNYIGFMKKIQTQNKLEVLELRKVLKIMSTSGIDFLISVTWSGMGDQVQLQLQADRLIVKLDDANNIVSIATVPTTITVIKPWDQAGIVAGFELAKLFQKIDPVFPKAPDNLKWITFFASPTMPLMTYGQAKAACEAQPNARLPYASELLATEAIGPYRQGGIPALLVNAYYPVKDMERVSVQSHFLQKSRASSPFGLIANEIGMGTITGITYCVVGAPTLKTMQAQNIYKEMRKALTRKDLEARLSMEYLLMAIGDPGAYNSDTSYGYDAQEKYRYTGLTGALSDLKKSGYNINLSEYALE